MFCECVVCSLCEASVNKLLSKSPAVNKCMFAAFGVRPTVQSLLVFRLQVFHSLMLYRHLQNVATNLL